MSPSSDKFNINPTLARVFGKEIKTVIYSQWHNKQMLIDVFCVKCFQGDLQ